MNQLTSQQRKIAYLVGIVVLFIPIFLLGMPASGTPDDPDASPGGKLARLRAEHDLGETSLGQVDPASATMNLVLLGFRGPASTLLAMDLEEQKKTKNWAQMRATANSITLLQPHFIQVWRYQGWNLAYNVSAEWDAVADRYYWVKEGAKYTMAGSRRNEQNPELYWETGRVLGQKIGRSDEWQIFRKFFKADPDEDTYGGYADTELNPKGIDNYLAAKDVFVIANERELEQPQHIMMRMLFRSYPARSQFDYADALQREGIFDEVTQVAWDTAYKEWTQDYGQEIFDTPGGDIRLNATEADIEELAKKDGVTIETKKEWVDRYHKIGNYPYWRTRALAESERQTVEAHREIFEGQQLFRESKLQEAREKLESGMEKYAGMLRRHPALLTETMALEEALNAVIYWRYTLLLLGEQVPEDFALREIWNANQGQVPELEMRFRRDNGIQGIE